MGFLVGRCSLLFLLFPLLEVAAKRRRRGSLAFELAPCKMENGLQSNCHCLAGIKLFGFSASNKSFVLVYYATLLLVILKE